MDLFVKKSAEDLLHEADNEGGRGLKRVLGPWGLIALGVGVIIGAGLFSVTGIVAGEHTGPAIVISFALAAIACALAGLCYAEFAVNAARVRLCIHLFILYHGRTCGLGHRLGPRARICRGISSHFHFVEQVFQHHDVRHRVRHTC